MDYPRRGWLESARLGVGAHWTAQSRALGEQRSFEDAVERFRLEPFLDGLDQAGADYLIFTATHALQKIPAPCAALDRVLPGRTATRDLLGELAEGLSARGKRLVVYYNHSCNSGDDPEWEAACGYHTDPSRLCATVFAILEELGMRYGALVAAWWFDSPYSLDARGPVNQVTSHAISGFRWPWEAMSQVARSGNPDRLVTYNAGIGEGFLYTAAQDYWAGEMVDLQPPTGPRHDNGLWWTGWACLDDPGWVFQGGPFAPPRFSDEAILTQRRRCMAHGAPMAFNLAVSQEGFWPSESLAQLARTAP